MDTNKKIDGSYFKEFLKNVIFPYKQQDSVIKYHDVHSQRYAGTVNVMSKLPLYSGMRILELAAEPYGMTAYLADNFKNVTIANYSQENIEKTINIIIDKKDNYITEYGFNVEQDVWPLPEVSFDLVLACEIVEHLAMDPMAMFAGANRVIRPGGYFLVSTPNAASIQNILKIARLVPAGLAQQFRRPLSMARLYERHNREYNPFTIGEMMKAAGFEVEIMETDSSFPLFDLGYSPEDIQTIIDIIKIPELRCDTINIIGKKIGGVVDRYPEVHDLYVASDG